MAANVIAVIQRNMVLALRVSIISVLVFGKVIVEVVQRILVLSKKVDLVAGVNSEEVPELPVRQSFLLSLFGRRCFDTAEMPVC